MEKTKKYFEVFLWNGKVLKIHWEILEENENFLKIKENKTNRIYRIKSYINIIEYNEPKIWNNLFNNLEDEKF